MFLKYLRPQVDILGEQNQIHPESMINQISSYLTPTLEQNVSNEKRHNTQILSSKANEELRSLCPVEESENNCHHSPKKSDTHASLKFDFGSLSSLQQILKQNFSLIQLQLRDLKDQNSILNEKLTTLQNEPSIKQKPKSNQEIEIPEQVQLQVSKMQPIENPSELPGKSVPMSQLNSQSEEEKQDQQENHEPVQRQLQQNEDKIHLFASTQNDQKGFTENQFKQINEIIAQKLQEKSKELQQIIDMQTKSKIEALQLLNEQKQPHEPVHIEENAAFAELKSQNKQDSNLERQIEISKAHSSDQESKKIEIEKLNFEQDEKTELTKNRQHEALLEKVKQLSSDVLRLSQEVFQERKSNSNKFNQVQKTILDFERVLEKQSNKPKSFEEEVNKLKAQLQEYQLKKERKYLKLLSEQGSASPKGQNQMQKFNDYLEYLSEKVNFLLQCNKDFVPRLDYDSEITKIHEIFYSIRKKLAEKLDSVQGEKMIQLSSKTQLQSLFKILDAKSPEDASSQNDIIENIKNVLQSEHSRIFGELNRKPQEVISEKDSEPDTKENRQQGAFPNNRQIIENLESQIKDCLGSVLDLKLKDIADLKVSTNQVVNELIPELSRKSKDHEEFMKNMNNFYNDKFKEYEIQLIDQQEALNKVTNQLKFYKFTKEGQNNFVSGSTVVTMPKGSKDIIVKHVDELSVNEQSQQQRATEAHKLKSKSRHLGESADIKEQENPESKRRVMRRYKSTDIGQEPELQPSVNVPTEQEQQYLLRNKLQLKGSFNPEAADKSSVLASNNLMIGGANADQSYEVGNLKKKVNKLYIFIDTIKNDLNKLRKQMIKQIEVIKNSDEKKTDWESFKKGMSYFDDKLKQTNKTVNELIESLVEKQEEDESKGNNLAVKKKWTCLSCDKELKNYDGKLGDAKFLSVFPNRFESPRVGGYYKQSARDKEYNQLYLNNKSKPKQ